MSRVIAIIGRTHCGKSYYLKKKIKNKTHLINDIKGEYKAGFKVYHNSGDREGFLNWVDEKCNQTIIVLEEASFYLSTRHYSSTAIKLFVNKWKSNNTYFVVFHSISSLPTWMYTYLDIVVLFKTNDILPNIKKHPKAVLDAFQVVNKKSIGNKRFKQIVTLDDTV